MDLDALREALNGVNPSSPVGWWAESEFGKPVFDAARAVLDSEEADMCITHKEPRWDARAADVCVVDDISCRVEPVLLVRRRLLAEEGT